MNIAEKAFLEIFPEKNIEDYDFEIKYNNKFNDYNANVKYFRNNFQFNLSKKWKNVSEEIQSGLIQELLLKIFRLKKKTTNIDLYNLFMKNVHISVPKTKTDAILEESFNKVNEKYFFGLLERPNLVWGNFSLRKLGHYEYGSDTISISRVFRNSDMDILDYVMYHEMLHKKHKFNSKGMRNFHHTKEFKSSEKKFENSSLMEEKISRLVRKESARNPLKRSIFGLNF
ncbi:hypothetical protein J4458_02530 [Candidatus Woesearchaeota archaeon]|nr:hypothetical protein [Candidatus Woesearchaeota archaeon]